MGHEGIRYPCDQCDYITNTSSVRSIPFDALGMASLMSQKCKKSVPRRLTRISHQLAPFSSGIVDSDQNLNIRVLVFALSQFTDSQGPLFRYINFLNESI